MSRSHPGRLLIKGLFSAVALFVLYKLADVELVLQSLRSTDLFWALAAVAFGTMVVPVNGFRWGRISAHVSSPLPNWFSILTYAEGLFFAMITPAAVGGDVLRVTRATRAFGNLRGNMASVLLDRAVNLAALVILAALVLPFIPIEGPAVKAAIFFMLIVIAVLAAMPYFALAALRRRRFRRFALVREGLRLAILFRRFLGSIRAFAEISCLSAIVLLLVMGVMLSAGRAVGASGLGPVEAAAAFSIALLVAALPISLAGLGPREGVMIWTLMGFGVEAGHAYAIAILFTAAHLASALPGLLIWLSGVTGLDRRNRGPGSGLGPGKLKRHAGTHLK